MIIAKWHNQPVKQTLVQDIICPYGIIRAIIILAVARLFLSPFQTHMFTSSSRLEVFLFLAGILDIFSRSIGLIDTTNKNESRIERMKHASTKTIRLLFLSKYGGQLLIPVWLGCIIVYLFCK